MYIKSAYAPVGMTNATSSKINVATNTASVPFCRPHSRAIHFCCGIPETNFFAIKYASTIIVTFKINTAKPASAR